MMQQHTQSIRQSGQALTELIIVMPVIAAFFVAVFYFGYGMNQKIENAMAVRHVAFSYNTDRGRDPDEMQTPVTAADLKSAFFTRDRNVQLVATDWGTTKKTEWEEFVTDSFAKSKRFWRGDHGKWRPQKAVATYLGLTGQPRGTHVTTRTTIDSNGIGFRIPFKPFTPAPQVVEASLFLDQKTRKLESASFNLGDIFDPGDWDFGYLPVMLAYMGPGDPIDGWDWDFASNCMSLLLLQLQIFDSEWGLSICPGI